MKLNYALNGAALNSPVREISMLRVMSTVLFAIECNIEDD